MEQKITTSQDSLNIGKIVIAFSGLNLLYAVLRTIAIISAQYGMISFSKKNLAIMVVLAVLDFVYWRKLKHSGNSGMATAALIIGIISSLVACFYIFMLIMGYLYPSLN
jgi:hypothetical protein